MKHTEKARSKHDSPVAKARLWRNIFAATAAAMTVQLVFILDRPSVLVVTSALILLLVVGLVLPQSRLRRILADSVES